MSGDDGDEDEPNPFDDLGEVDLADDGPITDETVEATESTSSGSRQSTTTQSSSRDTSRGPELSDS